jgi:hypothetical protein
MAYVAPGTVESGSVWTASQVNVIVNDLLQFAPFVQGVFTTEAVRDAAITAPTEGMHAYLTAPTVPTGTGGAQTIYNGAAWVCVTPQGATVATAQTTSSTSYADLATVGPAVTLVTGTSAIITVCTQTTADAAASSRIGYAVSGASTIAATDTTAAVLVVSAAGVPNLTISTTQIITGLTAGTNVFTAKYKVSASTATFTNRSITVQGIA